MCRVRSMLYTYALKQPLRSHDKGSQYAKFAPRQGGARGVGIIRCPCKSCPQRLCYLFQSVKEIGLFTNISRNFFSVFFYLSCYVNSQHVKQNKIPFTSFSVSFFFNFSFQFFVQIIRTTLIQGDSTKYIYCGIKQSRGKTDQHKNGLDLTVIIIISEY